MGKRRKVIGNLGYKKTSGASHGKFYVVDMDHAGDLTKVHSIGIESLKSIYPNIGKTLKSISPITKKMATPYPPIGKDMALQGKRKVRIAKSSSIYPPLIENGIIEVKVTEDLLDKVTQITGKAVSSSLEKRIVKSPYPPVGIVLVEKGKIIKVIKNNGRK